MLWLLVAGTLAAAMDAPAPGDLTTALAREASGDSAGALASVEAVVRAWPAEALPRLEAARLLLKLGGHLELAETHLDVAAAVAPDNPRVHYLRGLLWEERGQPLRAAQAYELALFYRPSYEDARFRLAGLWASLGDWLKAELHYRHLARSRPEWVQVRLQLVRALEEQGRGEDVERELLLLHGEQPSNTLVTRRLADLYERTGRLHLASRLRASLEPPAPSKKMRSLRPSRREETFRSLPDCAGGATAYTAPALKTANLAIVFTDIQGFTERTSRQTLEENQRLLKVHHDLLTPLFKAFGGRILKSIGDSFLVTFESPTQAVLGGMAIQDRLWQYNRGALDAERLDVRVAINVGEVRLESNDVFGEPVNIASRVESIAEAGEVYFTEAVYLAMNKAEVPSQEVGAFELKGIPGKIRVFRVPHAPYRVETPSVVHLPSTPEAALAHEQPPFGNLALSRIPESALAPGTDLAATAATLGGQLVERTRTVLQSVKTARRRPLSPRMLTVGGGALALLLLGLGFVVLRDSPAEASIKAVAKASAPEEKLERAEKARKLILEEKALGPKNWLLGQLDEALDSPNRAVEHYRLAVRGGSNKAGDRLVELLKHEECRVRANAADALGDLRLESARGELEDLAKDGGPGEESGVPLFGCNSRKAAQKALERLNR